MVSSSIAIDETIEMLHRQDYLDYMRSGFGDECRDLVRLHSRDYSC